MIKTLPISVSHSSSYFASSPSDPFLRSVAHRSHISMNRSLALHHSWGYKPSMAGLSLSTAYSSRLVETPDTQPTISGAPVAQGCKVQESSLGAKLEGMDDPPKVAESKEIMAARKQIEPVLLPEKVAAVHAIKGGISGAHVFRVTMEDGRVYCAKVVLSMAKIAFPEVMKSEHLNYAWAAERGLAPAIAFSDPETGLLITDFYPNEMGEWYDGGKEPRLSATLIAMRSLHEAKTPVKNCRYSLSRAIISWEGKFCRLSADLRQTPFAQIADRVARICIDHLARITYDAVPCHGDFHQGNVIFNSGKAWLIDWGDLEVSDPMKELAYFAYFVDVNLGLLDGLIDKYDATMARLNRDRAAYHLALLQASRYLLTLRGMEWETKMWKEDRLAVLEGYLVEDAAWLGVKVV